MAGGLLTNGIVADGGLVGDDAKKYERIGEVEGEMLETRTEPGVKMFSLGEVEGDEVGVTAGPSEEEAEDASESERGRVLTWLLGPPMGMGLEALWGADVEFWDMV